MIYTILSEPRTGSTNLYWWLKNGLPDFIVLCEMSNPISIDFISSDLNDLTWIDKTKNYFINEKFTSGVDFNRLISISTKVVGLYRENDTEQIESFIQAEATSNWVFEYEPNHHIVSNINTMYIDRKEYFLKLKSDFKELLYQYHIISFSYEDLYYRSKIDELKEYFNIDIDKPFPYGKKYRINLSPNKLI